MKCKEIFSRLGDYLDREIDPGLCDEIDRHIKDCPPCIAFINTLRKTVDIFQGMGNKTSEATIPDNISKNLKDFMQENREKEEAKPE